MLYVIEHTKKTKLLEETGERQLRIPTTHEDPANPSKKWEPDYKPPPPPQKKVEKLEIISPFLGVGDLNVRFDSRTIKARGNPRE